MAKITKSEAQLFYKDLSEWWEKNNAQLYDIEDNYYHVHDEQYIREGLFKIGHAIDDLLDAYRNLTDQIYDKELADEIEKKSLKLIEGFGQFVKIKEQDTK